MFSPSHQFGFSVFTFLLFCVNLTFSQINHIIERTSKEKEISTIAFFGQSPELEFVLLEADGNIPRMVYTESYGELYFASSFNKNILMVATINLWQRSTLNRIDIAFRGIHAASRSIYLIPDNRYRNLRYLADHFEWCWARGFVNVLVVFASTNETFSYTRFPEMTILRGTVDLQFFPDRFDNLMGYTLRTPLQYDPPRVFEYIDSFGRSHVTGYCADLFLAFLRRYNATMKVVRINNSTEYDIPAIVHLIREGLVDISIHTYIDFEDTRSSYPVRMMQWCILVPFRGEINAYWYFIRPFQLYLWLSCLGTLIVLSLYVALEDRFRGTHYDLGRSCCEVFRYMLCLPIDDTRPFALYRAFRRSLVFMLGFMLTNLYLAYLTSFLAKIIFQPQIKTLAELVTENISIVARDFEIPLVLRNKGLPPGFKRLLVPATYSELETHDLLGSRRLAYITLDDKASFALVQQAHLRQPLYVIVDECLSTIPSGFLMARHSPFEGILNRFILRINSAGLLNKWWQDMYLNGKRAGILKFLASNQQQGPPLTMEHFQFAWIALAGGLGMATISAICEKIVWEIRKIKVIVVYH